MNNLVKYISNNEPDIGFGKQKTKKPDTYTFQKKVTMIRKKKNKNEGQMYVEDVLNIKYSARVLNVFLFYVSVVYAVIVYAWFIITNVTA